MTMENIRNHNDMKLVTSWEKYAKYVMSILKSYRKTNYAIQNNSKLFIDIWHYLVIGCFDWKISVFQQTVVRVFYILKKQPTGFSFVNSYITTAKQWTDAIKDNV